MPGRAHGEGDGEEYGLVGLAGERPEPLGDVDVGGVEDAGGVEVVQQPVGA